MPPTAGSSPTTSPSSPGSGSPSAPAKSRAYAEWMSSLGYRPVSTRHVNEGQGDLLMVGEKVLAGYGFRTDRRAHAEISAALGRRWSRSNWWTRGSITSTPRWPFSTITRSRSIRRRSARRRAAQLRALFPDAIVVGSADAYVLGLNVVSDGLHVVLPAAATGFAAQLRQAGFEPVGVDLSELLKGGGSVKCCTLEVFP